MVRDETDNRANHLRHWFHQPGKQSSGTILYRSYLVLFLSNAGRPISTIMRLSAHAPLLSIVHDRDYHARSFGRSIARFEARRLGRGSVRVTATRRTTPPRLPGLERFCP
jgi:hypothetical protein